MQSFDVYYAYAIDMFEVPILVIIFQISFSVVVRYTCQSIL